METHIKKALDLASKNGWSVSDWKAGFYSPLLDPLFWQALGKAMGWKEEMWWVNNYIEAWKYHWHRFIDHLAEGKDADSFFQDLLSDNKE